MAVLRPLCHCPGPLGMGAIDRRLQMLEDFEVDARRLRYLLHLLHELRAGRCRGGATTPWVLVLSTASAVAVLGGCSALTAEIKPPAASRPV